MFTVINTTLLLILGFIFLLHKYLSRNYDYWRKKGIFYIEPKPIFGNIVDIALFKTTIGEHLASLYNKTKEPFFGIFVFNKPHLVVRDLELVKTILVRDFQYFDNRTVVAPQHDQMISNMLFFNKGPEWKVTRAKMTPVFTSGKLKNMVGTINDVGETMKTYVEKNMTQPSLEAKEICAKFSTDVIALCAFGISAHSFDRDDAEFRKAGRDLVEFTLRNAIAQSSSFFMPGLVKLLRLGMVPPKVSAFLRDVFMQTIKYRDANAGKGKANDMIEAIMDLRNDAEFNKLVKFEGDVMVAQAAQFFLAGFETTSSTMAFTLYELCLQPDIQQRLRDEIQKTYKENGNSFTYDAIMGMKYFDMVLSETLRKYPVLPFLDRTCNTDYKIPNSDKVIEKGTPVYIPMFGLHYDPNYFPEPEKFDPERFSDSSKVTQFTYMPFGKGPRNCIGERFGLLTGKLGLAHILLNFKVERTANTPVPLQFEPRSFVLASKVGLPMKFTKDVTSAA